MSEQEETASGIIEIPVSMVSLPFGFDQRKEGLYFQAGDDDPPVRIAGPFMIEAQTRDERGCNWGLLLSWQDADGRQHRWAMPRGLLAGEGTELRAQLLDRGLFVASGRTARGHLLNFLASVTTVDRAWATDRLGWVGGAFALPDRTIGSEYGARVVYQSAEGGDHPYLCAGALADWQGGVAAPAEGNFRLMLAISGAFVGPLLGLLDEEGGGVHMRGPSSIGKSTALIAAASVWGKPARYLKQWRATANGLEGVAVAHSETLLCLDELGQLDPREAGSAAYLLANGQGKSRAGRSGTLRAPAAWRAFFLSSGEIGLAALAQRDTRSAARPGAGQEIRILDIEADAGKGFGLFDHLAGQASAERLARHVKEQAGQHHGHAGPAFVEGMIARGLESVADDLSACLRIFVDEYLPASATGQVARAARRFGLIGCAGELAISLGVLPWRAGTAEQAALVLFREWLLARGGAGLAEDVDAVSQVRAFMEAHGSSRFEIIRRGSDSQEHLGDGRSIINRVGFYRIDEESGMREYYIMKEGWKDVCAGLDPRRTARLLAEKGYLVRDSKGNSTVPKWLPGLGQQRVYVVAPLLLAGGEPIDGE
ncbi:MAG: DUF927 domain-containing protein [Sphingomonas sp.]|nr:DUF927 domain-containing protein [Sphingomonas sp.]